MHVPEPRESYRCGRAQAVVLGRGAQPLGNTLSLSPTNAIHWLNPVLFKAQRAKEALVQLSIGVSLQAQTGQQKGASTSGEPNEDYPESSGMLVYS